MVLPLPGTQFAWMVWPLLRMVSGMSWNDGDTDESGKKLAQDGRPDADFSADKRDRDNADSSKNA